jgi:small subunit ribosomal protein S29
MSLARAFMHLDGHKIRNGYKVAASSIYPYQAHTFLPKHIHYSENYAVELKVPSIVKYQGLPLDHYRDFCDYTFQNNGWVCADPFDQANVEQFWMET